MSDPNDLDEVEPTPKPPRKRGLRRFAIRALIVLGVIALLLFVSRWQVGRIGQRHLNAANQQLDTEEPGWRLEALLAERNKTAPPPEENSAPAVLAVAKEIPSDWKKASRHGAAGAWPTDWPRHYPENTLPSASIIESLMEYAELTAAVRQKAVALRGKRSGFYRLEIPDDPISARFPHLDQAHGVATLLHFDGHLAALMKNPNRGIQSARAALAVARSIGDEPTMIAQLFRISCAKVATQTALQVIAWGEPTEELSQLQAELLAEAETPYFPTAIRGERAILDKVFTGLESGTIPTDQLMRYSSIVRPGPEHFAAFRVYRPLIPGDHAKCLQLMSDYYTAAKLPHHEQLPAIKLIEIPKGPPEDFRYIITRMVLPACDKVAEATLRGRAELLTAAVAIACERFRQKTGRWPKELTELTPTFLPAVPLNPFDGKPVGYRIFEDRITVYCYWADAPVQMHEPIEFRGGEPKGLGVGYRVWLPQHRALPHKE
ncbi:MAG: hypothetical protein L0241_30655 [Planctomycetia bacterium]|nr:hypothetical protein [Planctomycetia bacterium]